MEELIRKQDAIDAMLGDKVEITNVIRAIGNERDFEVLNTTCDRHAEIIKALPPVQPQQMKGRWLPDNNFVYEMRFVCSVCKESEVVPTIGFTKYKPIWDFCPNCGAKMERNDDGTD